MCDWETRPQAGANKAAAAARDADLRPILEAMRDQTYREIAQALTDRGIKTPRSWERHGLKRWIEALRAGKVVGRIVLTN